MQFVKEYYQFQIVFATIRFIIFGVHMSILIIIQVKIFVLMK